MVSGKILVRDRQVLTADEEAVRAEAQVQAEALARRVASDPVHEGMALLEAMAHGMPIVASGIPAVREVVGDAGLLADPTDEVDFYSNIRDLLNNPKWRKQLGDRAAWRASDFTFSESAGQLFEHYTEMLGK